MIKQKYTSKNTSINSKKLPRIYGLVHVDSNETVIDYGCGKFFDSYNLGPNFSGYDPFNRNHPELLTKKYDKAFCSNVLNVVAEREVRHEILKNLSQLAGKVYITIYEGNRTNIESPTMKDCFQLNWTRDKYIPELIDIFGSSHVKWDKKGYFECDSVAKDDIMEVVA